MLPLAGVLLLTLSAAATTAGFTTSVAQGFSPAVAARKGCTAGCETGSGDYTITILKSDIPHPEYETSAKLVGKSIEELFGPLAEVRVELDRVNRTDIDDDAAKVEQRIRGRMDRATCLGRDSEVAWHKAPWAHGYLLLKDGRILPIRIMLSGIVVDELLFAEKSAPEDAANGAAPGR